MYIGPKKFEGSVFIQHYDFDDSFYLRIGSFEAYLTRVEMDDLIRKGRKTLLECGLKMAGKKKMLIKK